MVVFPGHLRSPAVFCLLDSRRLFFFEEFFPGFVTTAARLSDGIESKAITRRTRQREVDIFGVLVILIYIFS